MGKLVFNKDGDYLVELNYVLYKMDDRRNGTLLFERIPWGLSSTSPKNMLFGGDDKDPDGVYWCKKIELTNGSYYYGNGLAVDNKNGKPIIVRCLMWIKVVNGVTVQYEQKDCKVLDKFSKKNNVQLNIGYFGANNVAYNEHVTNMKLYYKINSDDTTRTYYRYTDGKYYNICNFNNKFDDAAHNVYYFDLITMVDTWDGIGNSNDWLYSLLCSVGVYPLTESEETCSEWTIFKELETVLAKEEFLFEYSVEKWERTYKHIPRFRELFIDTINKTNPKLFLYEIENLPKNSKDLLYSCISYLYELRKLINNYRNSEELKIAQENEPYYNDFEYLREFQKTYNYIIYDSYGAGWMTLLDRFGTDCHLNKEQSEAYHTIYEMLAKYNGTEIRPLFNVLNTNSNINKLFIEILLPYLKKSMI